MNYLAHSFLSNNDQGLLIGNFIADHVRGNNFQNYPEKVIEGIMLHRRIDAFTDSHPKFKESKRFFYDHFEKYSGILVDIYFDHLLAKNFDKVSDVPLQEYCKNVYKIYEENTNLLPETSAGFLKYVLKNNIYSAYSTLEGIETVLFHLSHRIKHGVLLNESLAIFKKNKKQMADNFEFFFMEARAEFL